MASRRFVRRGGSWVTVLALAAAAPATARAQLILSLPTTLTAHPGDTITIPVTLTETGNVLDASHGNGISGVAFAVSYNSTLATVPGSSLALGSLLPSGMTVSAQFVFTADQGSAWNIDDVYVDPYAR